MKLFLSLLAGLVVGFLGLVAWHALAYFTGMEFGYLAWGIAAAIGYAMFYINGQKKSIIVGILAALVSILTFAAIRLYPMLDAFTYIDSLDAMTNEQRTAMYNNDIVEYADSYSGMNFDDYKAGELAKKDLSLVDIYKTTYLNGDDGLFELLIWFIMIVAGFLVGRGKNPDEIEAEQSEKDDFVDHDSSANTNK